MMAMRIASFGPAFFLEESSAGSSALALPTSSAEAGGQRGRVCEELATIDAAHGSTLLSDGSNWGIARRIHHNFRRSPDVKRLIPCRNHSRHRARAGIDDPRRFRRSAVTGPSARPYPETC